MADSKETSPDDLPYPLRVAEVGLIGLLLFAAAGALEAAIWCGRVEYPEPWVVFRRAVLEYLGAGLALGLLWGCACEATLCRRFGFRRRRLYFGTLGVALLTLLGVVYTHLDLLDPAVRVTSAISLAVAGGQLALGAILIAGLVSWSRSTTIAPETRACGPTCFSVAALVVLSTLGMPEIARRWPAAGPADLPNVLLIVLDTTRFDRLSAFGYHLNTTPTLARLASEGAAFTCAYSASPWTLPSHASIFTGVYPALHAATSEHQVLAEELPTLAERLRERGLRTVAISQKGWLSHETGVFRGFDQAFDLLRSPRLPVLLEAHDYVSRRMRKKNDKGARAVTRSAKGWLRRHGNRPFFMFINYNEAHNGLIPQEPFRRKYLQELNDTHWGHDRGIDMVRFDLGEITFSELDVEIFGRLYDASVEYQDWRMGQLFDFLRERRLLDETLVIVTSDHGENLGEHGRLGHALSMADTLLHVPLVVRHPRRIPGGLRVDEPVETRRIGALIETLLDSVSPERLDREQLVRALSERSDGAVISEAYKPLLGGLDRDDLPLDAIYHRRRKSLILGDQKYVWSSDGADELYDLGRDPGELHNILTERQDVTDRLRVLLAEEERLFQETEREEVPRLSRETLEHLRAVGYLE